MSKLKIRKKVRISKIIMLVGSLVFFFTFLLFNIYSKKVNDTLKSISTIKLREYMEGYLSNDIGYDILNKKDLENIIVINKNKDGEILYVDYDLDRAYNLLQEVTYKLNTLITELENGNNKYNNKSVVSANRGILLKIPLFVSSKNILIANLGPKIYVPVNFVGTILTNIKTKITDYGLNNALAEMYITIKLNANLLIPLADENVSIDYDVLISSTIINGRVPEVYGGIISSKSDILSIPIK